MSRETDEKEIKKADRMPATTQLLEIQQGMHTINWIIKYRAFRSQIRPFKCSCVFGLLNKSVSEDGNTMLRCFTINTLAAGMVCDWGSDLL